MRRVLLSPPLPSPDFESNIGRIALGPSLVPSKKERHADPPARGLQPRSDRFGRSGSLMVSLAEGLALAEAADLKVSRPLVSLSYPVLSVVYPTTTRLPPSYLPFFPPCQPARTPGSDALPCQHALDLLVPADGGCARCARCRPCIQPHVPGEGPRYTGSIRIHPRLPAPHILARTHAHDSDAS